MITALKIKKGAHDGLIFSSGFQWRTRRGCTSLDAVLVVGDTKCAYAI